MRNIEGSIAAQDTEARSIEARGTAARSIAARIVASIAAQDTAARSIEASIAAARTVVQRTVARSIAAQDIDTLETHIQGTGTPSRPEQQAQRIGTQGTGTLDIGTPGTGTLEFDKTESGNRTTGHTKGSATIDRRCFRIDLASFQSPSLSRPGRNDTRDFTIELRSARMRR